VEGSSHAAFHGRWAILTDFAGDTLRGMNEADSLPQWNRFVRVGEPACVIAFTGTVLAANAHWIELFGLQPGVRHQAAATVLGQPHCPICSMLAEARDSSPVNALDLDVQIGDIRHVRLTGVPLAADALLVIMHDRTAEVQRMSWTASALSLLTDSLRTVPTNSTAPAPLTRRERDVLRCLAAGMTAREIAASLLISHNTARNHVQNVLHKLNAHNRAQAVASAYSHGLLAAAE